MTSRTVATWLFVTVATVFFSTGTYAADSTLATLEQGMSELIFRLSRSIVSVEASSELPSGGLGQGGGEVL
ncbi:MAG: hypothetical protein V3T31_04265, partial [candidate division Zixibacteria bacterium]